MADLKLELDIKTVEIQTALIQIAQSALSSTELFKLSKNQSTFKEFIDCILPTYRWSVKVEKDEQALWSIFSSVETSKLFLPAFLDSDNSLKTMSFDDADKLFIELGKKKLTDHQLSKATDAVLDSLDVNEKQRLIRQHDSLKLFIAYIPGSNKPYRESSRNLNRLLQNRRLYSRASLSSGSFLLGESLQEALHDNEVVFINERVNQQLFNKKVKVCDTQAVLNLLEKKPQLSEAKKRTTLISKLDINDNLSPEQLLSIRFLMHGSLSDNDITHELWSVGRDGAVWSRLHRECLSDNENWSILEHQISTSLKLSNNDKNRLNLKEENAHTVIAKVGSDIEFIDFENVVSSQEDAEEVLSLIEDKELWCRLPLHQTISGELSSINASCFLESKLNLPCELYDTLTWISSANSREVQKQQDDNIPKVNADKAIELALGLNEPSKYQSFILDMLDKLDFF